MGFEVTVDPDRHEAPMVLNASDAPLEDVAAALDNSNQPLFAALTRWAASTGRPSRRGSLFDRDRYVSPDTTFGQIETARGAMVDDVVSGAADTTESLVFDEISFFVDDENEQDIWNQWAEDVDLDSRMREMWRQTIPDSQCVFALWWGRRSYRPRGRTKSGRAKRKEFNNLRVPVAVSMIDTLKVTPVGTVLFGAERLAYVADSFESTAFDKILGNLGSGSALNAPIGDYSDFASDEIVERLIERRYRPDKVEERELAKHGVDPTNLFLLREDSVFRHTLTRPGFKRFSDVRMRSLFDLLDRKNLLQGMDRTFLLGGSHWILLIRKGTDEHPVEEQSEITNLQAQVRTLASIPVIVGDHRLSVDIITPDQDHTLAREKYDTLDVRIAARMYQTFVATGEDTDDPLKLGKVIAQGLESRRKMMKRTWESKVFRPMQRLNSHQLTEKPKLKFSPDQIMLAFDDAWASFLLEMRQSKEISRHTIHSQFGLDQDDEARLREREAEHYDDVFGTIVPFGSPDNDGNGDGGDADTTRVQTRSGGRNGGGNRNGGGRAKPGSGQGKPARNPRKKAD